MCLGYTYTAHPAGITDKGQDLGDELNSNKLEENYWHEEGRKEDEIRQVSGSMMDKAQSPIINFKGYYKTNPQDTEE